MRGFRAGRKWGSPTTLSSEKWDVEIALRILADVKSLWGALESENRSAGKERQEREIPIRLLQKQNNNDKKITIIYCWAYKSTQILTSVSSITYSNNHRWRLFKISVSSMRFNREQTETSHRDIWVSNLTNVCYLEFKKKCEQCLKFILVWSHNELKHLSSNTHDYYFVMLYLCWCLKSSHTAAHAQNMSHGYYIKCVWGCILKNRRWCIYIRAAVIVKMIYSYILWGLLIHIISHKQKDKYIEYNSNI